MKSVGGADISPAGQATRPFVDAIRSRIDILEYPLELAHTHLTDLYVKNIGRPAIVSRIFTRPPAA